MKPIKQKETWTIENGHAQNQAREKYLKFSMERSPRSSQARWRGVRHAAEAVLNFAYEPLTRLTSRSRRRIRKQLVEILEKHHVLARTVDLKLDEPTLRKGQRELRDALAWLVLRVYWDIPRLCIPWPAPTTRIETTYMPVSVGFILKQQKRTPSYLNIVSSALDTLSLGVSWIRFCELCGRMFFKVKRQRLCASRRCKDVFHARQRSEKLDGTRRRKFDVSVRRGRPRKDYAAEMQAMHSEWLRMAEKTTMNPKRKR